jgi:hypothetical protein
VSDYRNPNGTYDGTKVLSALTGGTLSPKDVHGLWDEVKANIDAWKNCPAPWHVVDQIEGKIPAKFQCRTCGAITDGGKMLAYIEGFEAAGGDKRAVWPAGYEERA